MGQKLNPKKEILPYIDFLNKNQQSPVDYVLELFEKYDIVILVEGYHLDVIPYKCPFVSSRSLARFLYRPLR